MPIDTDADVDSDEDASGTVRGGEACMFICVNVFDENDCDCDGSVLSLCIPRESMSSRKSCARSRVSRCKLNLHLCNCTHLAHACRVRFDDVNTVQ